MPEHIVLMWSKLCIHSCFVSNSICMYAWIYVCIILLIWELFTPPLAVMVFHWSLSDKSLRVSRTLLNSLGDLNNTVVWMVFTNPLISKSSNPYTNPLVIVSSAPITLGITVTFMFHNFCCFPARSRYFLSFPFLSVLLCDQLERENPLIGNFFFFFFLQTIKRSGRLTEIKWSVCIWKVHRILCVSISRMDSMLCIYHLFV